MYLEEEKYYVIKGMEAYGGSFIRGLAQALAHADYNNMFKIVSAWRDEWNKYYEMGRYLEEQGK